MPQWMGVFRSWCTREATNSFAVHRAQTEVGRTHLGEKNVQYPQTELLLAAHVAGRTYSRFAVRTLQKTPTIQESSAVAEVVPTVGIFAAYCN